MNKQFVGKYFQNTEDYLGDSIANRSNSNMMALKIKFAIRDQKKEMRKKIFGNHYNYSNVSLNKEKKFLKEEEKNTEIERSNRILLEKIQRIAKRSVPNPQKLRNNTQQPQSNNREELLRTLFKKQSQYNKRLFDNKRMNDCQSRTTQNSTFKIVLFRGKKQIDGINFMFTIFIQNKMYIILSEHNKIQQKMAIGIQEYNMLLKDYLEENHQKIFDFMHVNYKGMLEIIGINQQILDNITSEENSLPNPQAIEK